MSDTGVARAVVVADRVGAPLSELAREYLYHVPIMNITVPGWVAERMICCGWQWTVSTETASIWLLAEGVSQLLAAGSPALPNRYSHVMSHLEAANPDRANDPRELTVPIPGADFSVALAKLITRLRGTRQDTVLTALIRGIGKLHSTDLGHDCASRATEHLRTGGISPRDRVTSGPQESAVLAQVPLTHQALGMLAPRQIMPPSLPRFVDEWVLCIAHDWVVPASDTVTWLLAEGAAALYATEFRDDTTWRAYRTRYDIRPGTYQRPRRPIEIPGDRLQMSLGALASVSGFDLEEVVTLAVSVGASIWQQDHGCGCGPRHFAPNMFRSDPKPPHP